MKKIVLLLVCLLALHQLSFAQGPRGKEKIKALKVSYITNELNLTATEAEKFWPVYNASEQKNKDLRREMRSIRKSLGDKNGIISEKEAAVMLDKFINIESQIHNNNMDLIKKLKSILPATKIIKLKKAEDDFNKKVLETLRKRRGPNGGPSQKRLGRN